MSYDPTDDPEENAMQLSGGLTPTNQKSKPYDYQGAILSYYDNLSRHLMASSYGGNAQQSWMKGSTPDAAGETAAQYHARTAWTSEGRHGTVFHPGRISARTSPGPGSGPGGGLVSGGLNGPTGNVGGLTPKTDWNANFAHTSSPIIGGGLVAGAWNSTGQKELEGIRSQFGTPQKAFDFRGVSRIIPAVDDDASKLADKIFV